MYIWGSEYANNQGKLFVRRVEDRSFSLGDFRVAVYHKRHRKYTQWKDIGSKMSVPLVAQSIEYSDTPHLYALTILDRYRGMDEESGDIYRYLYHAQEGAIAAINKVRDASFTIQSVDGIAMVMGQSPDITSNESGLHSVLSALYLLQLMWGKWEQKDDVLYGIKISVPLLSVTMHYQKYILRRVDLLREHDIIIKMDLFEQSDGLVVQLTSRDMLLLEQFALRHKPLATWSLISTKDFTDSLVSSLHEFMGESGPDLPEGYIIKIGTVQ